MHVVLLSLQMVGGGDESEAQYVKKTLEPKSRGGARFEDPWRKETLADGSELYTHREKLSTFSATRTPGQTDLMYKNQVKNKKQRRIRMVRSS